MPSPVNKVVSWNIANINGLMGIKSDDPDFVKLLTPHEVICLQETVNEVNIPGYFSYSDLRTNRRGGGVVTLVRSSLKRRCKQWMPRQEIIAKSPINISIIRLCQEQSKPSLYIVNVYIPPHNSVRKGSTATTSSSFDALQTIICELRECGEVLLCGDLNARIGSSCDYIPCSLPNGIEDDENEHLLIPSCAAISNVRSSFDTQTNPHKQHLLDLVGAQQILILNGRTIGDSNGKFTCIKWNGNSVVDYFICSEGLLRSVRSLEVCDHTLYSDHNPVVLNFWLNKDHSRIKPQTSAQKEIKDLEESPFRYDCSPSSLKAFSEKLSTPEFAESLQNLTSSDDTIPGSRSHAERLNSGLLTLINSAASSTLDIRKMGTSIKPKHEQWFDKDCRSARRLLRKSVRIVGEHPNDRSIKDKHRENIKGYRKKVKSKLDKFLRKLNEKIKKGSTVSWNDLKKLKKFKKNEVKLDDSLIPEFHQFYSKLYADQHPTLDNLTKQVLLQDAERIINDPDSDPNALLNSPFEIDELNSAIGGLKSGKASSFDHISNEMIKALTPQFKDSLLLLFNSCLSSGSYFWGNSVITPIHKKGCVTNPDNYRAIAVCSCIGKLLSTMLLNRLVIHRADNSPDPPNQSGFCKGRQCNDHIFTLQTIMEKYKRVKSKVYAVFIDLRKAFDLVCRQALLFKLACYGVNGGFFNLLKDMYSDSKGHIKINGKLSKVFRLLKGTEQGHPLSPELFKVYFLELSHLLNRAPTNCPTLSGLTITHLAWADDLVILALDEKSLQIQLDIIEKYCRDWGLEINISKTKFMVLNSTKKWNCRWRPSLNGSDLELVNSYCYLGIIINSTGKFTEAAEALYKKGLGALFSMRKTTDRRFIDARNHDKLFKSLIQPILTYGSQIWLPTLPLTKQLLKEMEETGSFVNSLKKISSLPAEKVHLRHLKYLLGINKKSVNVTAWGETGNFPLFIDSLYLCIKYFTRVIRLPETNFARAAIKEQINLQLSWFSSIKRIIELFDTVKRSEYQLSSLEVTNAGMMAAFCSPDTIRTKLKEVFTTSWDHFISNSPKLEFYREVKHTFSWEPYLDDSRTFNDRRFTAKIRSSSHRLKIEVGRHQGIPRSERTCDYCAKSGISAIEDEKHVLQSCLLSSSARTKVKEELSSVVPHLDSLQLITARFEIIQRNKPTDDNTVAAKRAVELSTRFINNTYHVVMKSRSASSA